MAQNVDETEYRTIERLAYRKISDYVLVRPIGRGTHYTLYQAVDPRLGRMVVIKTLHVAVGKPAAEGDTNLARVLEARLQREAHALSALSHPNIPEIYEMGEQDGHPFLVMEYLVGHPLRQHLDQGALPAAEAVRILEQVASAVDAAHAQGILHRDIRASNIMRLHDGRIKLVEFGLARQPGDATVTLMGSLVGEPAYMAPEQLRNQPASPQSDLWAVGVLLYEMLAGRSPFEGANFQMTAHQVIMGQPAPVPHLPPAVQAVLSQALEKDPAKRYSQAEDMVDALRKAVAGSPPIRPRPAAAFLGAPVRAAREIDIRVPILLAVLALSIVVGLFTAHLSSRTAPTASAATLRTVILPHRPFTHKMPFNPAVR